MSGITIKSERHPTRNKKKEVSRKIAILEKEKEVGIRDASRKSVEFRRGIRQTVKRNFSRQRGKEQISHFTPNRYGGPAPHPPFSLNRIGLTRINFYELEKGTLRLINYRLKVRCR